MRGVRKQGVQRQGGERFGAISQLVGAALMSSKMVRLVAVGMVVAATMTIGGTASAQNATCDDATVSSSADLITRGPTNIGPVSVVIPAGRYRLVMTSTDPGHRPGHQPEQLNERWSFSLDNGYSSPITPDLPTDVTSAVYDMGVVEMAAASSLTFLHHGVMPSADSVQPSVTFRCEAAPPTTTEAPTTTVEAPTTTIEALTTTTPVTEGGNVDPTSSVAPETSAVKSTEATTTTVVVASSELPRTGGNPSFVWMGLLLVTVGGVFIVVGKIVTLESARLSHR